MDKNLVQRIVNQVVSDMKNGGISGYEYGVFDSMDDAIEAAHVSRSY